MKIHDEIDLGALKEKISKKDAERQAKTVNRLLSLLQTQPGVILADEVGMGKTFVALATALTYIFNAKRNKRILILTPNKELKDKWDRDIDTFRISCIKDKSPLKRLARDKGIDSIKELLREKTPILTIPLNRVAGAPKEDEILCYLGAYFRTRGFSIDKRKEMLKALRADYNLKTIGNITDSLVMSPEEWAFNDFWQYENVKDLNFEPFDETIRKGSSRKEFKKEFKEACRKIRNQLLPDFAFCIIDEAHNYKNPRTIGHRLFSNEESPGITLKGKFEKMLFLTATPFQLGYDELLNIFKMFSAARSYSEKDFGETIDRLKTLFDKHKNVVERFEKEWQRFSERANENITEEDIKRVLDEGTDDVSQKYSEAREAKHALELELRSLLVRNVKPEKHTYRAVIFGSCCPDKRYKAGLDIPDKDKPLFFSLLRLEHEITREAKNRTFSGLTDSMATSSYTTLKDSKMLKGLPSEKIQTNRIIENYRKILPKLIPKDDGKHPKVEDVVKKVVERYVNGEKSLVFTFYIKTAESLSKVIKDNIDKERIARLKGITKKGDIDKYIENTQKRFNSPNDLRYLVMRENLLLTHYSSIAQDSQIKPDEEDWKQITQYLGENGYSFKAKKHDYRMLLKVMEHHFFKKAVKSKLIKGQDSIVKRVLESDYIKYGLFKTDEEKHKQRVNQILPREYDISRDDINHVKWLKAIQYILKGPNIWSHHKELLHKMDNLGLRRSIQRYIIREITREDLIIEKFISAKYKDEDERWVNIIEKIYSYEKMFNRTFKPETLKERVARFLKSIIEEYEKIKYGEDANKEIEKLKEMFNELLKIRNVEDVREIHGNSNVDRSVYFGAFNSPFRPVVLICTSIGSEGIDLQHECSGIFLYDLGWNPAALEQKIGRIDRVGSKNSRELGMAKEVGKDPKIEIYRPFIKGTRDERMHRVLQHREKWFNFLLGTGQRLPDDENGDNARNIDQIEEEERMLPLPEEVLKSLTMNLGV